MNTFNKSRQMPPKIGLFGGTFNPLHLGHLQVAKDVLQQFDLDQIHFIPCALPPHKTNEPLAEAGHRLEMVRLSVIDQPELTASDVEIKRKGPSYTCDTLRTYRREILPDARLYFMVGLDAFLEIHTWKMFLRLFDEAEFIVMSRPGFAHSTTTLLDKTVAYVQKHISPNYGFADGEKMIGHPSRPPIYLAAVKPIDITSTKIRQKIQNGACIDQWVTPAVARYIEKKGLYR